MADEDKDTAWSAMSIADMETGFGGHFVRARASLGVLSFGLSILELGPNSTGYPAHAHLRDRQEEVYLALEGSGTLTVDGTAIELDKETLVRVSWWARRALVAGPHGIRLLVVGGRPGQVYSAPPFSELGAPDDARRSGPDAQAT